MVTDGVLTEAQADEYRAIMKDLTGLQTEDLLMLIAANTIGGSTGGGGTSAPPILITSGGPVLSGNSYNVNTTVGPISLILPPTPQLGDKIEFYDMQSTWGINNLTIVNNGQKIDANLGNLIADLSNAHMQLMFNGGAQGWSVYNL